MITAAICLGIYAVIVAGLLVANHRWHEQQRAEQAQSEHVNWLPLLPPVPRPTTPPFTQTVAAADWFAGIPSDCLGDDAIRALADDIERREFS